MNELRRRVMESGGKEYPLGIWAYYANGSIRDYEHADSNAIGVAVVTENCRFVMEKNYPNNEVAFGGMNVNLSSNVYTTDNNKNQALADFNGKKNTDGIISGLYNYYDGYVTGAPAAELCRSRFDGNGYLGSVGEWIEVYKNKTEVYAMFSKIGGSILKNWWLWTSTLSEDSDEGHTRAWLVRLDSSSESDSIYRQKRSGSTTYRIHAFQPL